jgi:hypothetical protein
LSEIFDNELYDMDHNTYTNANLFKVRPNLIGLVDSNEYMFKLEEDIVKRLRMEERL